MWIRLYLHFYPQSILSFTINIDFYGKIEHFVEVFANDFQTILCLFKNPFMHYVRYKGKSILASKGAPLLMNKWKYYLVNFWQCHFYVWSQPLRIHINQLSKHSLRLSRLSFKCATKSFSGTESNARKCIYNR